MKKKTKHKDDAAHHTFEPAVAKQVGVQAAVVYRNLVFWIRHNEANNKNFREGRHWTYNSYKAFGMQFSYLSEKQIRNAMAKLVDEGFILKGNFSEDRFDRQNWYALADTKCPNGQMEEAEQADDGSAQKGSLAAQKGECIKNRYKPDLKPYPSDLGGDVEEVDHLDAVWRAYPVDRRRDAKTCQKLVNDALTQVSLAELVAAASAYGIESADTPRSKVSFLDNWLRQGKWLRHIEDQRWQQKTLETKVNDRRACPASALRVISFDDSALIEEWDQILSSWGLQPLAQLAQRGAEGGREGWFWPLQWVPSDASQLAHVERYARWLDEQNIDEDTVQRSDLHRKES